MDRKEQIIDEWGEWLPPDPHRQWVLDQVVKGRASIVHPDDDAPPLLLYEDGGSMVLPQVRWAGEGRPWSAGEPEIDESGERRNTKYYDVCSSVDEFKEHVAEGPEKLAEERENIDRLFDDIRHMIGRMYRRQRQYTDFADRLRQIIAELEAVEIIDRAPSDEGLAEIERLLDRDAPAEAERLNDLAEQVRDVASRQEQRLREHKAAALAVLEAYRQARGPRDWSEDEDE
ncbi:MAG: hypothetical protein GF393_12105 [Armatimonadia bacterium]|nr:hypothetical protein [Armatimonadia bacterium]